MKLRDVRMAYLQGDEIEWIVHLKPPEEVDYEIMEIEGNCLWTKGCCKGFIQEHG